ncbi:MAG: acyl-CoA dehydrogenase family protein [Pseudobdellovibrionaceae bacterium]
MPDYRPPVDAMLALLYEALPTKDVLEGADMDAETGEAILTEAAKLAADILAPLNETGDREGLKLENGALTMPKGFKDAYAQYRDAGWNAVPFAAEYGGQELPWSLAFPIQEMWQGANLSFGLCPLLNQGAIDAIEAHGSDAQKEEYLPHLISGLWTGTMNLTEPQAGSDLGALKSKAVKQDDGSYKISGQKIYITYGEHDMAENIIHLVLARVEGAPEGSKGISLFIVPKFLKDGDKYTKRNDLYCVSVEHKLGIHASPTCTMAYGDKGGATGYLVGVENEGLKYMFTMMNNARLSVGLQGVAIAERSYQAAVAYAKDRVQGKSMVTGENVVIAEHADVKRMLLDMAARVMGGRAMTYEAAAYLDKARGGDEAAQIRVELMTPVVKSWCTDMSLNVTSTGVQVHGGMGFVEETGAAQYYRDARILPIYEGTNGIQAADLIFRKLMRDQGVGFSAWLKETDALAASHDGTKGDALRRTVKELGEAFKVLAGLGSEKDMDALAALSVPFLNAMGTVMAGVGMLKLDGKTTDPHVQNVIEAYFSLVLPDFYAFKAQINAETAKMITETGF